MPIEKICARFGDDYWLKRDKEGGFPAELYKIRYDAPGSPEMAVRVHAFLQAAGIPARLNETPPAERSSPASVP